MIELLIHLGYIAVGAAAAWYLMLGQVKFWQTRAGFAEDERARLEAFIAHPSSRTVDLGNSAVKHD